MVDYTKMMINFLHSLDTRTDEEHMSDSSVMVGKNLLLPLLLLSFQSDTLSRQSKNSNSRKIYMSETLKQL